MPCKKISIDFLFLKILGQAGKYQIWIILCLLPVKFSEGWHQLATIIVTRPTMFKCALFEGNITKEAENFTCYSDCIKYKYDRTEFHNNAIMQWDLICERKWMASLLQTMFMFGVVLGNAVFGLISDKWGRRKACLISVIGLVVFGFATPFSTNYTQFIIFRFMVGVFVGGDMIVTFILCLELVGPKYREVIGFIHHVPVIFGHVTVILFAYYLRNWNTFLFGLAIPSFYFLIYFYIVPESPRWLISVGKLEDANELIINIAKRNRTPVNNIEQIIKQIYKEFNQDKRTTASYKDLFSQDLRLKTFCSMALWFGIGFGYFGSFQFISLITTKLFLTVGITAIIQLPAKFLAFYCLKRFGRKVTIVACLLVGAICTLGLTFNINTYWFIVMTGSIGVGAFSSAYLAVYIYSSELFPTVTRNMGVGLSSSAAKIGAMIAPFVSMYGNEYIDWLPPVLFAIVPVAACILCFFLPETTGKELLDIFPKAEVLS